MAYTRLVCGRKHGLYNYCEFVCDSVADLTSLPTVNSSGISNGNEHNACSVGSRAFVIAGSRYYIMSNTGEWIEVNAASIPF